MFDKPYEDRLVLWREFRNHLEEGNDPIQEAINFYEKAPVVSIHTDPWTPAMWPNPWQLLQENQYCDFCKLLAIGYTLLLTERFSRSKFWIHIVLDQENSCTYYLLTVDDRTIGYEGKTHIAKSNLPTNLQFKQSYPLQITH